MWEYTGQAQFGLALIVAASLVHTGTWSRGCPPIVANSGGLCRPSRQKVPLNCLEEPRSPPPCTVDEGYDLAHTMAPSKQHTEYSFC